MTSGIVAVDSLDGVGSVRGSLGGLTVVLDEVVLRLGGMLILF